MEVTCLNLVLVKIWKEVYNKGGDNMEGSGIFMSHTYCQGIEISVKQGRVVTTLNIIKHKISHLV